jgi:flavin reductase (DIM6/NTAB) family NADH-FMN oxidoreductase RutF
MNKIQIDKNFMIPMPVVLLGSNVDGKANFMAVGWCARVNGVPPMILCSVGNKRYTVKGVTQSETFSINLPAKKLLEKTDYCGVVSGSRTDKSKVFDVFYGELGSAPMINECTVNLECALKESISLPSHTLLIGEIITAYADEDVINADAPDFEKINPMILTMPDNRYWSLGEHLGDAWKAGYSLK